MRYVLCGVWSECTFVRYEHLQKHFPRLLHNFKIIYKYQQLEKAYLGKHFAPPFAGFSQMTSQLWKASFHTENNCNHFCIQWRQQIKIFRDRKFIFSSIFKKCLRFYLAISNSQNKHIKNKHICSSIFGVKQIFFTSELPHSNFSPVLDMLRANFFSLKFSNKMVELWREPLQAVYFRQI